MQRRHVCAASLLGGLLLLLLPAARASAHVSTGPAPRPTDVAPWPASDLVFDADLRGRFILHLAFEPDGDAWLAASDGLYGTDGYTWRRYTTADGLPSNFVRCVLVAQDGTLWIGTDQGVAVLDGVRFRTRPGPRGHAPLNVRRMVEDPDGSILFCCDRWLRADATAGLWRLRDGTWSRWDTERGLRTDCVQNTYFDADGRWYALTDEGLAWFRDDAWRYPIEEAGLVAPGEPFWSMCEAADGDVLAATARSLFVLRAGRWLRYDHRGDQGLAKNLFRLGDRVLTRVWRGQDAIHAWDGAAFVPTGIPVPRDAMAEITLAAPDGAIWSVGSSTLDRWAPPDEEWSVFTDLPPPAGTDADGRPWFVGRDGAVFLDGDRATRVPELRGRITFDDPGAVWGWTRNDVTRFADGRLEVYEAADLGLAAITDLRIDARGAAWVRGRHRDGQAALATFDAGAWTRLAPAWLQGAAIDDWAADSTGAIWLVLRERAAPPRLMRVEDGAPVEVFGMPEATWVGAAGVYADRAGRLWVYGDSGLYRHEHGAWRAIEGLPGRSTLRPHEQDGSLWIITAAITGGRQGISRFRDGAWKHWERPVHGVIGRGDDGTLLFAGDGSIYRTDEASASGLVRMHVPIPGRIRTAMADRRGDLWLGVGDRVLRFRADGVPPRTFLQILTPSPHEGEPLVVDATAVDRFRPRHREFHEYAWRIDDGPWTAFGPIPERGIKLPGGAGRYAIEIRARDEGLDVDPAPPRAVVEVLPVPLQARPWFAPVAISLFVLLALLAAAAAIAGLKVRRHAATLEDVVTSRTARLRHSEARLRSILENIPFDFWVQDADGRVLMQNTTARTHWGDRLGRDGGDLDLPPDELARWRDAWAQARAGTVVSDELRVTRDGERRTWSLIAAPVIDEHEIVGALAIQIDTTERTRTERRQKLLRDELDHRVKNNLATVLSLLDFTDAAADSHEAFLHSFRGRVRALAHAHEALAAGNWRGVRLDEMLQRLLGPDLAAHGTRLSASGPPVTLPAHASGPLAMCLHELATNAARHGALAEDDGRVEIGWSRADENRLALRWIEEHDRPCPPPRSQGLGLGLIRGLVEFELRGRFDCDFGPRGIRCAIEVPLEQGRDEPRPARVPAPEPKTDVVVPEEA